MRRPAGFLASAPRPASAARLAGPLPIVALATLTACGVLRDRAPEAELLPSDSLPVRFARTFTGVIGGETPVALELHRDGDALTGAWSDGPSGSTEEGRWMTGTIGPGLAFRLDEHGDGSDEPMALLEGVFEFDDRGLWHLVGTRLPRGEDPVGPAPFALVETRVELPGGHAVVSRDVLATDSARGWVFYAQVPLAVDPDGEPADAPPLDRLNAALEREVEAALAEFVALHDEEPDPTLERIIAEVGPGWYESWYGVTLAEAGVVAFRFDVSIYFAGAAHPNHHTWTLVWDLERGRRIALGDLFRPGIDWPAWVSRQTIRRLASRLGDLSDSDWIRRGAGPDPANFSAWAPTPEGILLVFDPYQVAAYAAGPQEVAIAWRELAGVLDPAGPFANRAR